MYVPLGRDKSSFATEELVRQLQNTFWYGMWKPASVEINSDTYQSQPSTELDFARYLPGFLTRSHSLDSQKPWLGRLNASKSMTEEAFKLSFPSKSELKFFPSSWCLLPEILRRAQLGQILYDKGTSATHC